MATRGEPHEGWLTKKGQVRKNWKRRWFVLEGGQLKYFPSKVSQAQKITSAERTLYVYADTSEELETWKQKLITHGASWMNSSNPDPSSVPSKTNTQPPTQTTTKTETNQQAPTTSTVTETKPQTNPSQPVEAQLVAPKKSEENPAEVVPTTNSNENSASAQSSAPTNTISSETKPTTESTQTNSRVPSQDTPKVETQPTTTTTVETKEEQRANAPQETKTEVRKTTSSNWIPAARPSQAQQPQIEPAQAESAQTEPEKPAQTATASEGSKIVETTPEAKTTEQPQETKQQVPSQPTSSVESPTTEQPAPIQAAQVETTPPNAEAPKPVQAPQVQQTEVKQTESQKLPQTTPAVAPQPTEVKSIETKQEVPQKASQPTSSVEIFETHSKVTMRIAGSLATFDGDKFIADIAKTLNIDPKSIKITSTAEGSVIVSFQIADTSSTDSATVANNLTHLVQSNDPSLAAAGILVLDLNVDTSTAATVQNAAPQMATQTQAPEQKEVGSSTDNTQQSHESTQTAQITGSESKDLTNSQTQTQQASSLDLISSQTQTVQAPVPDLTSSQTQTHQQPTLSSQTQTHQQEASSTEPPKDLTSSQTQTEHAASPAVAATQPTSELKLSEPKAEDPKDDTPPEPIPEVEFCLQPAAEHNFVPMAKPSPTKSALPKLLITLLDYSPLIDGLADFKELLESDPYAVTTSQFDASVYMKSLENNQTLGTGYAWTLFPGKLQEIPKEEEFLNQLNNYDQVLAFTNDPKLFPKKEILPLVRTIVSLKAQTGDKIMCVLEERMAAFKAGCSPPEQPIKLPALANSTLQTPAQVVLTTAVDLVTHLTADLSKSPDFSLIHGILDTLLGSLRKFPILSLCVDSNLDDLTLETALKLAAWIEGLCKNSPLDIKKKALHILLELIFATGSIQLMLSLTSQILLMSPKDQKDFFPLHGVQDRLASFLQLREQTVPPNWSSLGISTRVLGLWTNFDLVSNNQPEYASDSELAMTQQHLRTMATDGSYLYIHDGYGLRKFGTGYNGTEKTYLYAANRGYRFMEKLWMVHYDNYLYCTTSDDQSTEFVIISCDTLQEVNGQSLSFPSEGESGEHKETKQRVLISDGVDFIVLRQEEETQRVHVDIYTPQSTQNKISSFEHKKHIVLKNSLDQPQTEISLDKFALGSYLSNGRNLIALIPRPDNTPESSVMYTFHLSTGIQGQNWIGPDPQSIHAEETRALVTSCYDAVNNMVWSYAPCSKMMRLFKPLGIPNYYCAQTRGYPLAVHKIQKQLLKNQDSTDSVTSSQLITSLLGHSLVLSQKVRTQVEEISLPLTGPIPVKEPDQRTYGPRKKVVVMPPDLTAPFSIQPSIGTFAQFCVTLDSLASAFETQPNSLNEWMLLSVLKLLRSNLVTWLLSRNNIDGFQSQLENDKLVIVLKRILDIKSSRQVLPLIQSEACECLLIGTEFLFSTPKEQLETMYDLLETCFQNGTTHILYHIIQRFDMSRWFNSEQADTRDLLNKFIDKILSRVQASCKQLIETIDTVANAQLADHAAEHRILFVFQRQLIISASTLDKAREQLIAFASKILNSAWELVELISNSPKFMGSMMIRKMILSILLPYLITALPHTLQGANIPSMWRLLKSLDRINIQRPDLAETLQNYLKTIMDAEKRKKPKGNFVLPVLLDLEVSIAWATGKMAGHLIKGKPVSEHELTFKSFLEYDLFSKGISTDFLQNYTKIIAAGSQGTDAQLKFLEAFIQDNRKGLYTSIVSFLNKGRVVPLAEDVVQLERTVIAVLLKHLNLVSMAMEQAEHIANGEPYKDIPELSAVWFKAEKYRKWAVQEAQKMSSENDADLESEGNEEEDAKPNLIELLTQKARFLLFLTTAEEVKTEKPKITLASVAKKWKSAAKITTPTPAAESTNTTEQDEAKESVTWGRFFQIWKSKRQVSVKEEFEKTSNEVLTFLKDEETNNLENFCNAVKSQAERAVTRKQGLEALISVLQQVKLPAAKLLIIGNLSTAIRITDETVVQKQIHSVLDNIQTCGDKLTQQVLSAFNAVYSDIKDLLVGEDLDPSSKLVLLDLWNNSFVKNEKFVLDSGILDLLLNIHVSSFSKMEPKNSGQVKKKDQPKEDDPNEALHETSWLLIRSLFLESSCKKQTQNQVSVTTAFVQRFYDHLILTTAVAVDSQQKPETGLFKQSGITDELHQQLIERILSLLYAMCQKYSNAHTKYLCSPAWVQLLLNLIRCTSLQSKVLAFRLLRLILPKVEVSSLDSIKLVASFEPNSGLDILRFFFQFVGATYEGSSDCADTIQSMVFVTTTHDIFAIAAEIIMLIRLLMNEPTWKPRILAFVMESIEKLGLLFSSKERVTTRSRTKTAIARETRTHWNIIAALCVLGGHRDTLRLGARISLSEPDNSSDKDSESSAQNMGTVVEFHRMNPTVKIIQDSHRDPIKVDVNNLAGALEVPPDVSVVMTTSALENLVAIIKKDTPQVQLRSAVLKVLVEILESETESGKVKEMLINNDFLAPLLEICLLPSQFKTELSVVQLLELSQCLHEVLLSEKEIPRCTICMTTQASTVNVEQRVQTLVELGYVPDFLVNQCRLAFSQMDLNGDGVLTLEEIMEASHLNLEGEDLQEFRDQIMRADRNKDGTIDFLEFVMMTVGLIDFCFPDETEEEEAKEVPTLQIQRPTLVAGSYKLVLKNGQALPEQPITGDLIEIEVNKEYLDDIKGCILLVEPSKVDKPLADAVKEWESKGALAVVVVGEKLPAELNVESLTKIPLLALTPKDATTISSALSVSAGNVLKNQNENKEQADTIEADANMMIMESMGFAPNDIEEAVQKFGIKNMRACVGWLFVKESTGADKLPKKNAPAKKSPKEIMEDEEQEEEQEGAIPSRLKLPMGLTPEMLAEMDEEEAALIMQQVMQQQQEVEDMDEETAARYFAMMQQMGAGMKMQMDEEEEEIDLFGGFSMEFRTEVTDSDDDEDSAEDKSEKKPDKTDSENKENSAEPTYLAKYLASSNAAEKIDNSKSNKKSFIAQFEELDLSNLRGELHRVENSISVYYSRKAIISILSNWPASKPLTSKSLGVGSSAIIYIFRFAISILKSPARLEHLCKVFVSLVEEKDSDFGYQFMQECIGHIVLHTRTPAEVRKQFPRETGNLNFSLAALQVFLRSQTGLSAYCNVLGKIISELVRALETANSQLRVSIVDVLTQILLSMRDNIQSYRSLNTSELGTSFNIMQSTLHKQFVNDRKNGNVVGSLYLQSVAELVAVAQSVIIALNDLKDNSNNQKNASTSLLEELYHERASQTQVDAVTLVPATFDTLLTIQDGAVYVEEDNYIGSSFVSVTCSKYITSGRYFYEVVIDRKYEEFFGSSKMIAQIGWAAKGFAPNEQEGLGVGDDEHSWGYDGGRKRKWHKGKWSAYSKPAWKEGDIIGCAVDLDIGKMFFFLNGKPLGEAFSEIVVPQGGIRPAATFKSELLLRFNFGKIPFRFPLPGFQSVEPQIPSDSGLKLPDFELYCRNFHLINTLYYRSNLSENIIKYAIQRHQDKPKTNIKLNFVCSDAPNSANEKYAKEDFASYRCQNTKNVHLILTSDSEFIAALFCLTTAEAHTVLVFILDEKPDLSQFSAFDNFTREQWDKYVAEKNGQPPLPNEPVDFFQTNNNTGHVAYMHKGLVPRKGKFILLKVTSANSSRGQINFVVKGSPGPFSIYDTQPDAVSVDDIKWNNDAWTLDQDAQLITFCNSVGQKIGSSPMLLSAGQLMKYQSDPELMHAVPMLKQVKPEALVLRYFILALFNSELNSFFYWINLENLKDYTIATKLSHLRSCIFLEVKNMFLKHVLEGIVGSVPAQNIKLNRPKALQQRDGSAPKNNMETLFGQAFKQLSQSNPALFRASDQAWTTTFLGEGSIDAGGPYRESLSQFCTELQSDALDLLQKSPNGQHNVGFNREMWVPVASAKSNVQKSMYEFLGKLFGLALCSNFTLNLDLASMVYKPLVGQSVDINDLKAVDSMCVQSLEALRNIDKQGITEDTFEDVFMEVFSINGSDGKVIELVPGGQHKAVTFHNRFEWAELVEKTRINEFKLQVDAIKRGLATVIPTPVLSLFSWEELKISIEGKPNLDIQLLKQKTVYRAGYTADSEPVKLFWQNNTACSYDSHGADQGMLVWIETLIRRLPLYVDQFTQEFKLSKMYSQTPDATLPLSHTCFFELELPEYSTFEIMKEKLVYAITECQAIDTDFNPTSAANWE